jgi:hypothetical protein
MNPYPIHQGTAQTRGAQSQRTKVNFEINIPTVVQLEFNPPVEPREGRFGPQFMYFVNDGLEIGWFDPPLHTAIIESNALAGDTIAIVKRRAGRTIRWEVNHVKPEQHAAQAPPPPAALVSAPRDRAALIQRELVSTNLMTAALRQAIDAAHETEFAATHEDIRALAITIYIASTGGRK